MVQDNSTNKIADYGGNPAFDLRHRNSYLHRHIETDTSLQLVSYKMAMKHFHRG